MFSVTNNAAVFQHAELNLQIYPHKREGSKGMCVFHFDIATLTLLWVAPVYSPFPKAVVQSTVNTWLPTTVPSLTVLEARSREDLGFSSE